MAPHLLDEHAVVAWCRLCGLWRCRPVEHDQCHDCVPPLTETLGSVAGVHLAALLRPDLDLVDLRSDPEHLLHLDIAAAAVELRRRLRAAPLGRGSSAATITTAASATTNRIAVIVGARA